MRQNLPGAKLVPVTFFVSSSKNEVVPCVYGWAQPSPPEMPLSCPSTSKVCDPHLSFLTTEAFSEHPSVLLIDLGPIPFSLPSPLYECSSLQIHSLLVSGDIKTAKGCLFALSVKMFAFYIIEFDLKFCIWEVSEQEKFRWGVDAVPVSLHKYRNMFQKSGVLPYWQFHPLWY